MCVMYNVKLPVAAVCLLAGSGTYVIHRCSDALVVFLIVGKSV